MGIGPKLDHWHRRICRVGGELIYCIIKRRVTRSQVEAWERELRDLADAMRRASTHGMD